MWYYDKRCKNNRRCIARHYWGDKDKEAEEYKDFIDNKRYFLSLFPNGRPKFIERSKLRTSKISNYQELQRQQIHDSMPRVQK
jgi:hypothetical protein